MYDNVKDKGRIYDNFITHDEHLLMFCKCSKKID